MQAADIDCGYGGEGALVSRVASGSVAAPEPANNRHRVGFQLPKLLVIDDSRGVTDILEEVARGAGYDVVSVNDFHDIRIVYREMKPDLIFLDLDLGVDADMDTSEKGYDALAVFQFLAGLNCRSKIVLISSMDKAKRTLTKEIGREMKLAVVGSVSKPFSLETIEQILEKLKGGQTVEV